MQGRLGAVIGSGAFSISGLLPGSDCVPHLAQDAPTDFRPPAEIDRAVRAWMDSALPSGTGLDSAETFADIEQLSLRIGRAVACQLAERALRKQAADEPAETP